MKHYEEIRPVRTDIIKYICAFNKFLFVQISGLNKSRKFYAVENYTFLSGLFKDVVKCQEGTASVRHK